MIALIVRLILGAILCYFIYHETGWATTLFAALVAIESEVTTATIKNILKIIRVLK